MKASAWNRLQYCLPEPQRAPWLECMLKRNAGCAYLKQWGSPTSMQSFRNQVPLTDYEQLKPWISRIANGEVSLLFPDRPIAFEKTGGSSGTCKLIPYSSEGLTDFRRALLPWLADVVCRHQITGSAYFSLSPACRAQEYVAGVPVGLSDIAYVGEEAGAIFAAVSAVPPSVGALINHNEWRMQTLHYLRQAGDLELISAWSPTFLLRLFEGEDTQKLWPRLKVISCWASGMSTEYARSLQLLFPHTAIQPKGLISTEAAVTTPDSAGHPVLTDIGFFEFRIESTLLLQDELERGETYEVVATTASGLYRYCTGDRVTYEGHNSSGRAILQFVGRAGIVSDMVGEKLTESFVDSCLKGIAGFRMLVPNGEKDGYTLITEQHEVNGAILVTIESALKNNPQYAYARKLGQLKALKALSVRNPWKHYEHHQSKQGIRLGDIKPVALRSEHYWEQSFREQV